MGLKKAEALYPPLSTIRLLPDTQSVGGRGGADDGGGGRSSSGCGGDGTGGGDSSVVIGGLWFTWVVVLV